MGAPLMWFLVVAVAGAIAVLVFFAVRSAAACQLPRSPSPRTDTEILREAMADAVLGIPSTVFKSPGGNVLVQAEQPGKHEFSLSVVDMSPVLPAAELEADRQARVRANVGCSVMSAEEVARRIVAYEAHCKLVHEGATLQMAAVASKAVITAARRSGPQTSAAAMAEAMQAAVKAAVDGNGKVAEDIVDLLPQFPLG